MDAVLIIILVLAALAAIALGRLVGVVRRSWDGSIEDLYEDAVIRRLTIACITTLILVVVVLLRGPIRALLGIVLD